ncbi:MAG: hypothetical protein RSB59_06990, partial [Clostridia bacterium]
MNAEILFENLKNVQLTDRQLANKLNLQYIKPFYSKAYGSKTLSNQQRNKAFIAYRNSLLLSAQEDFDSFMLFMEIDRPIEERYWVHRRDKLWKACQALQDMTDDKIDVTFIAMPPRVGKSGLGLFYCSWIAGKYPQLSLLGIAFNNFLVDSFHGKLLNIIDNKFTYKFYEVFPTLENTLKVNKEYNLIDLGKKNEYGTIALRSIESGLAGGVEASSLFYFDDLISGIEEAVSPDRLKSKWDKFTGDGFQRMIGSKLKILFIGTIWSINDPQMLFRKHLEENTDKRVAIIEIPALDENEESNFDYKYKGISTKTYTQMIRPAVDEVTWKCVYMQEPIERQGLLFSIDQFARFDSDKLRDKPKAIHTFCDVAWGGGDNLAMPF